MKCSLCGKEFEEKESLPVCRGCPLKKGCELIRCPNCGYEWPREPEWLRKIFAKNKKLKEEEKYADK